VTRRAPTPLAFDDPRHGSVNAYTNLACRCDACRAEWARDVRVRRASWRLEPGDPRHGTLNGYSNYHCRCIACTAAGTAVRRPGTVSRALAPVHDIDCACQDCIAA
jgi:hypothetical protein